MYIHQNIQDMSSQTFKSMTVHFYNLTHESHKTVCSITIRNHTGFSNVPQCQSNIAQNSPRCLSSQSKHVTKL